MTEPGSRRIASWPAEHRAALSIVVHVAAQLPGVNAAHRELGVDYTADGLHRLLGLFGDLDVGVTTAWSGAALATYPQLARGAQDHGHELSLSIVDGVASGDDPEAVASHISDLPIVGLVASLPQSSSGEGKEERTASGAAAPRWTIDGSGGDVPRLGPQAGPSPGSVILPVSPYWIDRHWWHPEHPSPPSSLLESWSSGLASVRTLGGLMTVVVHPHISGRPGHAETLVRFVDEAIASADVWLARADQVAAWWLESMVPQRS